MMTAASLTYALVLFVQPSPEPRVYATFDTVTECRAERTSLVQDLPDGNITAICVPQNRMNMALIQSQMQQIMNTVRGLHDALPEAPNHQ